MSKYWGQKAPKRLQLIWEKLFGRATIFASISNEYKPINLQNLPSYLPAEKPPQVGEEYLDYQNALSLCGLQTLRERREKRCFDFSLKRYHTTGTE